MSALRQNFYWMLSGHVVYAACQWGILILLARLTSPEGVGQFTLGVAVTAPIVMLANMQLRSVQASDAASRFAFGSYLSLRVITSGAALCAIAAVVWGSGYSADTGAVVLAVGVAKIVESLADVFYGLQQRAERMSSVARSLMVRGGLSVLVIGPVLAVTGSVLAGALALGLAWAVILVVYDIPEAARMLSDRAEALRPVWRPDTLRQIARLALPLGVASFLVSLNTNIPRYVIQLNLGERELGIFAAFAYLTATGATVVSSLGQSMLPRLAMLYATGQRRGYLGLMAKMTAVIAGVTAAGWVAAAVAGEPLIRLVYGDTYAQYAFLLLPVIAWAAATFLTSLLTFAVTAVRQFDLQMPISVGAVAVTGAACALLVPRWGVEGAAWGAFTGAAIHALGNLAVIAYTLGSRRSEYEAAAGGLGTARLAQP